jgi:hypothetical protein
MRAGSGRRGAIGCPVLILVLAACGSSVVEPVASPAEVVGGQKDAAVIEPSPPGPQVIIPPGLVSSRSAEDMAQSMLDQIAAHERTIGRRLATPRIVRIQLLPPGQDDLYRRFDGHPTGHGASDAGLPVWVVEAVGTFAQGGPNFPEAWGMHGWLTWRDDGSDESWSFTKCWSERPISPDEMEGSCTP